MGANSKGKRKLEYSGKDIIGMSKKMTKIMEELILVLFQKIRN